MALTSKDRISFPATFVLWGIFLKQKSSVLEAVVRVRPLHNDRLKRFPSGFTRVEAVLGISAQKTVFLLEKKN